MASPLVLCAPNYSEARRLNVISEILSCIQKYPNIQVLDRISDPTQNRTVVTYAGPPDEVEEAAFLSIKTASHLIDLNVHTGSHPRIGAVDVVPLIPLRDITMPECVLIARRLGQRVGEELQIPVYLYEEAASTPERRFLENIRKGQYEALKSEILTNAERHPDFGPSVLGPAGATVIGARQHLISLNIFLSTSDIVIAQNIATAVHYASGGLNYIKAEAKSSDGHVFISLSCTEYQKSPLYRALELVRREAQRYGISIQGTKLVGMVPQDALVEAAAWYLQLDDLTPRQIIERCLLPPPVSPSPFIPFLDQLASPTPTPGGGAVAALTAASAAALVSMTAGVTMKNQSFISAFPKMSEIHSKAENCRVVLTEAVQKDSEAYQSFLSSRRKDSQPSNLTDAALDIVRVPLLVASQSLEILRLVVEIIELCPLNILVDAACASFLAESAVKISAMNVRSNIQYIQGSAAIHNFQTEITKIVSDTSELMIKIDQILEKRGFPPISSQKF